MPTAIDFKPAMTMLKVPITALPTNAAEAVTMIGQHFLPTSPASQLRADPPQPLAVIDPNTVNMAAPVAAPTGIPKWAIIAGVAGLAAVFLMSKPKRKRA